MPMVAGISGCLSHFIIWCVFVLMEPKSKTEIELELLEWVIKLVYSGMPLTWFRYYIIKKHEELEKQFNAEKAASDSSD